MSAFIISTIIPIVADWIKSAGPAISRKVFGETVDDQVKLMQADTGRLQALSALDNPYGTPAQWVINLRASFRYISAGTLILGGLGLAAWGFYKSNLEVVPIGLDLAASPFGFIFGERLQLSLSGKNR